MPVVSVSSVPLSEAAAGEAEGSGLSVVVAGEGDAVASSILLFPHPAIRKADRHIVAVTSNIFRFIEKFLLFEIRHLSTMVSSCQLVLLS